MRITIVNPAVQQTMKPVPKLNCDVAFQGFIEPKICM